MKLYKIDQSGGIMLRKAIFSICVFILSISFAQNKGDIIAGEFFTIKSEVLKQNRTIQISLPFNYETSQKEYPVLYILDGNGSFKFASAVVNFLSGSLRIPQMIVVGIPNIDRTFDLTPAPLNFRKSGNGKNFLKFLTEEVREVIDDTYRTSGYNILSGHSLGGNLTVFSLFDNPDRFNAYIAVSPYLASADNFTLNLVKQKIEDIDLEQKYLYAAIGNEPPYFDFMKEFTEIVRPKEKEGFTYFYEEMSNEDHMSIRLKGLYNGLEKLFEEWILTMSVAENGIDAIESHFESFEEKFGYAYKIPENLLNTIGYKMLEQNKKDIAIGIFFRNTQLYSESANAFHSLGDAFKRDKNYRLAFENIKKAVELAENKNHPNLALYKKELKEIEKYIFDN